MKFKKINIVLLSVLTVAILFFVLKDDFDDILKVFLNINKFYFIIALIILVLSDVFRTLSLYKIMRNSNNKIKFIDSYKLNLISQYFNNITPFATGSQPYQIYYLKKNFNINYSNGFAIAFLNFLFFQIVLCGISTIFLIINLIFNLIVLDIFIFKFVLLGYLVNLFVLIFLIFLLKKQKSKLILKIFGFLIKHKILKQEKVDKLFDKVDSFYMFLDNNKNKHFFRIMIFNVIYFLLTMLLSFFVLKSLNIESINIIKVSIAQIFVFLVCSFVPIPGGSLGFEIGYITIFSMFGANYLIKSSMLLWRFLTYYLFTIVGSIVFIFEKKRD